jgi:uncharacterized Fe-S cluster protein YjdI
MFNYITMDRQHPRVYSGSHVDSIKNTAEEMNNMNCVVTAGKVVGIDNKYWCGSCESYAVDFDTMSCTVCNNKF